MNLSLFYDSQSCFKTFGCLGRVRTNQTCQIERTNVFFVSLQFERDKNCVVFFSPQGPRGDRGPKGERVGPRSGPFSESSEGPALRLDVVVSVWL